MALRRFYGFPSNIVALPGSRSPSFPPPGSYPDFQRLPPTPLATRLPPTPPPPSPTLASRPPLPPSPRRSRRSVPGRLSITGRQSSPSWPICAKPPAPPIRPHAPPAPCAPPPRYSSCTSHPCFPRHRAPAWALTETRRRSVDPAAVLVAAPLATTKAWWRSSQMAGIVAQIQWTPASGVGEAMASATGSVQQQSPSTDADPGAGADKLVFEAAPQPMREDYVENAVKFLSHPKVRGSPVVYRGCFLEKKGLTFQEIDEARRGKSRQLGSRQWLSRSKTTTISQVLQQVICLQLLSLITPVNPHAHRAHIISLYMK
ncbi:WAS/WASL-interacting protein family member 3-like isoform X3 [Panicum virgatum]|uniref:WAS/WASL-interacting protein family member 3-like isoform X3 n=1 Tax=Panicum virgatum TaxID=38727 RepID=UPI0019D59052|nr:WAS/WASL-interacting protein family member 3-like isoform X3 [Panicum virgatum]